MIHFALADQRLEHLQCIFYIGFSQHMAIYMLALQILKHSRFALHTIVGDGCSHEALKAFYNLGVPFT